MNAPAPEAADVVVVVPGEQPRHDGRRPRL